jgi:acyl-coenzyme A synthetase/AMP-(fatty) acid ligase
MVGAALVTFIADELDGRTFAEQVALLARSRPEEIGVVGDRGAITWRDLADRAGPLTSDLAGPGGAGASAPVVVATADAVELAVAIVAAAAVGRAAAVVDPAGAPASIVAVAQQLEADTLLADPEIGREVGREHSAPWLRRLSIDRDHGGTFRPVSVDPERIALHLMTAGTTGTPTAVPITHRTLADDARASIGDGLVRPDDRLGRPRTSAGGTAGALVGAMLLGLRYVALDPRRVVAGRVLQAFVDHGVTYLHLSPSLLRMFTRSSHPRGPRLDGLRLVGGGGEAMRWSDVAAVAPLLQPGSRVLHSYGSTEVGAIARHLIDPHAKLGHGVVPVGRPAPGVTVHILADHHSAEAHDAQGDAPRQAVPVGELGAIHVTRSGGASDPVPTGDLGRLDERGLLHVAGRADRMVKVGGVRVEPAAIEALLAAVPGVEDVAVVPHRDDEVGTRLVAHVSVPGATTPAGSLTLLRERLVASAIPGAAGARVVMHDCRLPLLASGKLDIARLTAGGTHLR